MHPCGFSLSCLSCCVSHHFRFNALAFSSPLHGLRILLPFFSRFITPRLFSFSARAFAICFPTMHPCSLTFFLLYLPCLLSVTPTYLCLYPCIAGPHTHDKPMQHPIQVVIRLTWSCCMLSLLTTIPPYSVFSQVCQVPAAPAISLFTKSIIITRRFCY